MTRVNVSIIGLLLACSMAAASRSVWDGVFTKEQASRGQKAYREECLKCHGLNLNGGESGPPLAGADFLDAWNGKSVGSLFETIRKTMPEDDPGNLSSRQYTDLVAYILSENKFPAGEKEMDREVAALNEIQIARKQ